MAKAKLLFRELVQDSQDYGSNDEHMVSRVFFDLEINGAKHESLCADIKQSVGGSFETSSLEISRPLKYKGPFNYGAFRDAVEHYYRSLIGAAGAGIRIAGSANVRMRNNRFVQSRVVEFDVSGADSSW